MTKKNAKDESALLSLTDYLMGKSHTKDKQHSGKSSNEKVRGNSRTTVHELPVAETHWWVEHRG